MELPEDSNIPANNLTEISDTEVSDDETGKTESEQVLLLRRIQDFALDDGDPALSFSRRLAVENNWQMSYALSVIEEYKRFVFLALVAEHPVTPSDQIDQAWHLHLSYTRSYWEIFCPQVLKQPLHHEPTKGGKKEEEKFRQQYEQTLESYKKLFEEAPPEEIWPPVNVRFEQDVDFIRVNAQKNWIVPKLPISRGPLAAITGALMFSVGLFFLNGSALGNTSIRDFFVSAFLAITGYRSILFAASLLESLHRPFIAGGCGTDGAYGCGFDGA